MSMTCVTLKGDILCEHSIEDLHNSNAVEHLYNL